MNTLLYKQIKRYYYISTLNSICYFLSLVNHSIQFSTICLFYIQIYADVRLIRIICSSTAYIHQEYVFSEFRTANQLSRATYTFSIAYLYSFRSAGVALKWLVSSRLVVVDELDREQNTNVHGSPLIPSHASFFTSRSHRAEFKCSV